MDINIRAFGGELQCFCYNFDPDRVEHDSPIRRAPARSSAARRQRRTGRSEPEGPVHRRVARRLRIRGRCATSSSASKYIHREPRPRDRGLPGSVEGEYFIANPGAGHARQGAWASTTACTRRRRRSRSASNNAFELTRAEALQQQLAVPGELRLLEARRQLRRHVPELDRPARSEHQLGVRLRRLPGQRARAAEQRPQRTSSSSTAATRSPSGPLNGLNFGVAHALVLRHCRSPPTATRSRTRNWEYYLTAARLARPRTERLGSGPARLATR